MVYSYAINNGKTAYWNTARNFDIELWDLSEMFLVLKHEIEAKEPLCVSRRIFFWKTWEKSKQRMFISRVV